MQVTITQTPILPNCSHENHYQPKAKHSKHKIENVIRAYDGTPKLEVAMRRLKVHAAGVFGVSVLIHGPSAIFLGEKFLYFPVALFCSHAEF